MPGRKPVNVRNGQIVVGHEWFTAETMTPSVEKAPSAVSKVRRPKLGQNFLADSAVAARIVDALGDISHTTVLEIGPGKGVLTDGLAERAGRLIAIELDRVLAAQLRMKYSRRSNVEVIEGDILKTDLSTIVARQPGPLSSMAPKNHDPAKVVGNIPYYITSDILLHLFHYHPYVNEIVMMLQREVAERVTAKPGGSEYGLLSATSQLYGKVEKLFVVPPGAFEPPPKVQSAVIRLRVAPQFQALQVSEREFIEFLKLSFGQKRKTLLNNLKVRYSDQEIRSALAGAGVRSDVRAEALTLPKAASVFRKLAPASPPSGK